MKVRETTSVQEYVVLTNIKALDPCVCEYIYTHAITHTHTQILWNQINEKRMFFFFTLSLRSGVIDRIHLSSILCLGGEIRFSWCCEYRLNAVKLPCL